MEQVNEHDLSDVRCGCCGYMTYHREHMGCIRAATTESPEKPDETAALKARIAELEVDLQEQCRLHGQERERQISRIADLEAERDRYLDQLLGWKEKTEWVQDTFKPKELGMHRADILRQRIQELETVLAAAPKTVHSLPTGKLCECSQCQFVRMVRKVKYRR